MSPISRQARFLRKRTPNITDSRDSPARSRDYREAGRLKIETCTNWLQPGGVSIYGLRSLRHLAWHESCTV